MGNGIRLLTLIVDCYSLEGTNDKIEKSSTNIPPLIRAIQFTNDHFKESLTVKQAASHAGFSPSYFSRIFSEFMGMPYTKYLTELRLHAAQQMLQESRYTIAEIADLCSFSDRRAFTRAYKKKYQINPGEFRYTPSNSRESLVNRDISLETANHHLTTCINQLSQTDAKPVHLKMTCIPDISMSGFHKRFSHNWQKSIGVGQAYTLLDIHKQKILRLTQKQIGYEQAILHGILDDDMQVVYKDDAGHLSYFWGKIDTVLDFIVSINLRPMIQLGYMPSLLCGADARSLYERHCFISLPNDISEWERLIYSLLNHLFERYGQSQVEGWTFCLWSKPDAAPLPHGFEDIEKYFSFYHSTYQVIKTCSTNISFISPAFLPDSIYHDEWLIKFFPFAMNTIVCRMQFNLIFTLSNSRLATIISAVRSGLNTMIPIALCGNFFWMWLSSVRIIICHLANHSWRNGIFLFLKENMSMTPVTWRLLL